MGGHECVQPYIHPDPGITYHQLPRLSTGRPFGERKTKTSVYLYTLYSIKCMCTRQCCDAQNPSHFSSFTLLYLLATSLDPFNADLIALSPCIAVLIASACRRGARQPLLSAAAKSRRGAQYVGARSERRVTRPGANPALSLVNYSDQSIARRRGHCFSVGDV